MAQELWVEKHKPQSAEEMAGNKKILEETRVFMKQFIKGKALLLAGPPGVGKTLLVEVMAKETGFHLVEINASDERGKEEISSYTSASKNTSLFSKGKIIFIDEADALAGGDRGGAQAMVELIKSSYFPVVLAANDAYAPKLKSLRSHCTVLKFTKIPSPSIEKFLREICGKEGIEARGSVLKNLARFSDGDLRSAVTDLQLVAFGKKAIEDEDLEAIGYRERKSQIFSLLPTVFRSGSISTARKVIHESEEDPDEIFWWIENNAHLECAGEKLADIFDILSKADIFRSLVMKQQNWAFKGYMVDLMAAVTIHGKSGSQYVPYRPPDRFIQLSRSRAKRQEMSALCGKLGKELHCSKKVVRREFLPFLKIILGNGENLGMEKEDIEIII